MDLGWFLGGFGRILEGFRWILMGFRGVQLVSASTQGVEHRPALGGTPGIGRKPPLSHGRREAEPFSGL